MYNPMNPQTFAQSREPVHAHAGQTTTSASASSSPSSTTNNHTSAANEGEAVSGNWSQAHIPRTTTHAPASDYMQMHHHQEQPRQRTSHIASAPAPAAASVPHHRQYTTTSDGRTFPTSSFFSASHPTPQHAPANPSLSPQPTTNTRQSSSSHTQSVDSTSELYGPDRLFPQTAVAALATAPPALPKPVYNHASRRQQSGSVAAVRFDEAQLAMFAADNASRMPGIRDELAAAAGKITPGVDDTPYIQYAIEALTRDQEGMTASQFPDSSTSSEGYGAVRPSSRRILDEEMGFEPLEPLDEAQFQDEYTWGSPAQQRTSNNPPQLPQEQQTNSRVLAAEPTEQRHDEHWIPVSRHMRESIDPGSRTYPPLTFKPRILRPFSMMILMILCIFMMTTLIFSNVYSKRHNGLTPYSGTIYSGQYFVFRILPQLLGGIIITYAQCIIAASFRILPFTRMASDDAQERHLALFQNLYPKTFLWPQLVGPWQIKVFGIVSWLSYFTVPLLSAAFTNIYVAGIWTWAPVQAVVWLVVILYALLLVSTALVMVFWFGKWTGLVWDMRSIADVLPLLNRSNTMATYESAAATEDSSEFKEKLRDRWFDRLGYWQTADMTTGGIWYAIGSSAAHLEDGTLEKHEFGTKRHSNGPSVGSQELAIPRHLGIYRFKYLPFSLRSGLLATYAAVTGLLLLALLVVSFLPQTRLDDGFLPLLPARPTRNAFSAANFLYNFLPSLLGMLLFLVFQNFDHALRRVQPWGDLGRLNGAAARKSILADYAAGLPVQTTFKAFRNKHWRVAAVSAMSFLGIFIPILAGGLFIALTKPNGQVLMFPSMPVLGVLLALLILYVGCLFLLMPQRSQFLLPHAVDSIAQIISLCSAQELTQDAAFRSVRSRRDLEGRLGDSAWFFGMVPGRDEHRVSVRRMNRFTEKRSQPSAPPRYKKKSMV